MVLYASGSSWPAERDGPLRLETHERRRVAHARPRLRAPQAETRCHARMGEDVLVRVRDTAQRSASGGSGRVRDRDEAVQLAVELARAGGKRPDDLSGVELAGFDAHRELTMPSCQSSLIDGQT